MNDCLTTTNKTLKRVNEVLWSRYAKNVVSGYTRPPDRREHDTAVVVNRLEVALAEVQSKISMVKAHHKNDPLDRAPDEDTPPVAPHKHRAAPTPVKVKTTALRDALEEKLNAYRSDPGSMEALRDRVYAAQQEEHLQKLLHQPKLNYVALNRAAAHDPYAFTYAPLPGMVSTESEAILTTALNRLPESVTHASLPNTDPHGEVQPQDVSGRGIPQVAPKSTAITPHFTYNAAKLLERREHSRPEFQAAVVERATKQAQHMHRVHRKHGELLDQELERRRAGSARSARRSAAVARAKEQAELMADMHDRARPWMTLVAMFWRLAIIQGEVLSGRQHRKAEQQREHAATLIQRAWRSFDMMRRNKNMLHIVRQARHHLEPLVPRIRLRCRQRAACRIIEYLKNTARVGHTQAVIMRVQHQLRLIQKTWKDLHIIRKEQAGLLLAQLGAFEGKAIAANRRKLREKPASGVLRRTLPSESSKGTITSDSPVDVMHAALWKPLHTDSLSMLEMCSAEWKPKLANMTNRIASQYKSRAVQEALKQWRTAYMEKIREWQHSLKLYVESAKLDVMRVRLLQEAGIPNVQCQVLRPLRPCMRVVATHAELKEMLLQAHQCMLDTARQKAIMQRDKKDEELREFLKRRQDLSE